MCVLTYLPTPDGFILTNNRDEHASRPRAQAPRRYVLHGQEVFFPKDQQAGGTWLATSPRQTVCLLNGAFEPHHPQPPYRQSRGLVVLDFFGFCCPAGFAKKYIFEGLEPFTLLVFDSNQTLKITELRWNGERVFQRKIDATQPRIWSSVTLYPPDVVEAREGWFSDWQRANPVFEAGSIWDFHHHGGNGDRRNDLVMARPNGIHTFSVTQVQKAGETLCLAYRDLRSDEEWRLRVL